MMRRVFLVLTMKKLRLVIEGCGMFRVCFIYSGHGDSDVVLDTFKNHYRCLVLVIIILIIIIIMMHS